MKAIYNNTTNSLIAFKGDHRPIQIRKGGQLIDNISAVPLITEQDTYTSEYKANLVGLELQGNTEQNPNTSPTTPQTIKNSGDYSSIDYTIQIMDLIKSGNYSQAGVSGVALVNVPSELVDKNITYNLSASLPSGYSVGLLKGSNFLFGESVAINTIPITKSGFDSIYINGIASYEEIPALFDNVTLYAIEEQEGVKGIDVKLSGENKLISPSTFKDYFNENNYLEYDISTQTYLVNYTNVGVSSSICHFDTPIPAGTPYTLFAEVVNDDFELNKSSNQLMLGLYKKDDSGVAWAGKTLDLNGLNTNKVIIQSNITTQPTTDVWIFNNYKSGQYVKNLKVRFMVYFGDKTITEWQPYFNPVTVNIPSEVTLTDGTVVPLRFAKYRNADYLSMNNKQVKYFSYSIEGDPTKPLSEQAENVPPIEYDLTDTEVGQQLLALAEATQNQTNIITATSEIPLSKKIITYAKWGGDSEN